MIPGSKWLVGATSVLSLVAVQAHAQTSPQATPSKTTSSKTAPKASPTPSAPKISHWGVVISATPSWYVPSSITNSLTGDGGSIVVVGTQFAVGIVHGRAMGGDWGVTFVHEPVKDGSRGADTDTECGFTNGPLPGGCFNTGGGGVTRGVAMSGVQVHKFIPFGTIKRRVQLGMEFAGGVGKLSGTLEKTSSDVTNIVFNSKTNTQTGILTTTVTTEDAASEVLSTVPLGRITVVAALILTPAIKVRWEGGLMMPGATFSTVVVTYLFGAR